MQAGRVAEMKRNATKPRFRMNVKKSLLSWAIKRSGKSVDELEKKQSLGGIRKWLAGESQPTLRQLEKFAGATYTSLGSLFLSQPPEDPIPIPYFRTQGQSVSGISINLLDTIQIVEQRQDWMREHMMTSGYEPLAFVGSTGPNNPATKVAHKMRSELNLPEEWPSNLKTWGDVRADLADKMEESGVFVTINGIVGNNTRRQLLVEEFRGFVLVDDYAPFVFVNGRDAMSAQMFTMAHELAHVWMGESATFNLHKLDPADDAIEQACNKIAAEFLVPEEKMRQLWGKFSSKLNWYRLISRHFKVSPIVVVRKALDMALIDKKKFLELHEQLSKPNIKKGKGGNFYATTQYRLGKRFGSAVINAAREGKILYRDAYNLTGLNRVTFEKYATYIGADK